VLCCPRFTRSCVLCSSTTQVVMLQDCVSPMHKVHLHHLLDSSLGKAL